MNAEKGDLVRYHPIIGGPDNGKTYRVKATAIGIGSYNEPVAWLEGKAGCVSMKALSPAVESRDAPMTTSLSPTMQHALTFAKANGGRLVRHAGGYWSSAEWAKTSTGHIASFSTNTAHALVTRGVAEYSEWREGRSGRFPIELRILG